MAEKTPNDMIPRLLQGPPITPRTTDNDLLIALEKRRLERALRKGGVTRSASVLEASHRYFKNTKRE